MISLPHRTARLLFSRGNKKIEPSPSPPPGRRIFAVLCIILAIGALLVACLQYTTVKKFEVPIAYTVVGSRLYVLEKKGNTILDLEYLAPDKPLELRGRYRIEPEDAGHYYMVRKLYPGPEGVIVHSYIYTRKQGEKDREEEFIGYRFREYRSFRRPPREIFTILLQNPADVPELNYSAGPEGWHYFVNNCPGQQPIWKIPPAGSVSMAGGVLPPEITAGGEENGAFSSWDGIAVGGEGRVYLSSGSTNRIREYSPDFREYTDIGTVGWEEGDLLAPSELFFITLAHDLPRSLTVASTGNRTWVQFSPEGRVLLTIDPRREGYQDHFTDILVGPIYKMEPGGEIVTFDLVNRDLITLSRGFSFVTAYRSRQPLRSGLFIGLAALFLLAAVFSRRLTELAARLRFPFVAKLLLLFVPVIVISALIVGDEVRTIMKKDLDAEYVRRSANLAAAILEAVPVSDLKQLRGLNDREKPLYKEVYDRVAGIVNWEKVEYTPKWIIHLIDKEGRYFFGINIWRGSIYEPFIVPADRKIFKDVLDQKTPQYGRFTDEQGEWFSYLVPILDDGNDGTGDGAAGACDEKRVLNVLELYRPTEEMDRADRRAASAIRKDVGYTVLTAALLVLLFSFLFTHPLRRLIQGIKVVSRGDFEQKISVRSRDEIESVAGAFNQMVGDLKTYTRDLARTTAEKERIETELQVARQVQQSILPEVFPPTPECPSVEIFARMLPAREVGGDYYDFFPVDRDHIGVVVADVSGKGMPAGLFMMVVRTLLRNNAVNNLSAADAITRTNRIIAADNPSTLFVTVFYFICNLKTGRITFCNAGHNPPVIVKSTGVALLAASEGAGKNPAVGIIEDAEFTDGALTLAKGERLILYTDGVTEAFNEENQLFGEERLLDNVSRNTGLHNRELWKAICDQVSSFQSGREQFDDITMVLFTFLNSGNHP